MCNAKTSANPYRCDCDTSEKRQMRRVNRRQRDSVESRMSTLTIEKPTTPQRETHLAGAEHMQYEDSGDPRENINRLFTLMELQNVDADYVKAMKEVGHNVTLIAEEKSGVTQAEIQAAYDDYMEKDGIKKEYRKTVMAGIYKERNEIFNEYRAFKRENPDQEIPEELAKREKALEDRKKEAEEVESRMFKDSITAKREFEAKHEALGRGYRAAISEARNEEMGPDGPEGLNLHSLTRSKKRVAAEAAPHLDIYPRSWIEASNRKGNLIIRESTRRAHYLSSRSYQTKARIIPCSFMGDGEPPIDSAHEYRLLSKEEMQEIAPHLADNGTKYYERTEWTEFSKYEHDRGSFDDDMKWQSYYEKEGKPPGRGWQLKTVKKRVNYDLPYRDPNAYEDREVWMRKKRRHMQAAEKVHVAEVTVPKGEYHAGKIATLQHEFAHRMEASVSYLADAQRVYLESRTTNENGEREAQVNLYGTYGQNAERAYPDNFRNTYTGKTYNGRHFEVLSTGVEGLFSKSTGIYYSEKEGQTEMDTDLRDFVLGSLTSLHRPQKKED